jgi:hypothetical protein
VLAYRRWPRPSWPGGYQNRRCVRYLDAGHGRFAATLIVVLGELLLADTSLVPIQLWGGGTTGDHEGEKHDGDESKRVVSLVPFLAIICSPFRVAAPQAPADGLPGAPADVPLEGRARTRPR